MVKRLALADLLQRFGLALLAMPAVLLTSLSVGLPAQTPATITIAAGTRWATEAVITDSGVPGPTVVVIGGVHGDEPAGYRAARQIAGWRPAKGRLVVVPRANTLGLRGGTRRMPSLSKSVSDLNRQFPTADRAEPVGELATALWRFVCEQEPNFVIDLHEGFDFTQRNPKSVGSSLIGSRHLGTGAIARAARAAVNSTIAKQDLKFVLKKRAVNGSLVRAVSDRLKVPALILETTKKSQALALRARQHRLMVHAVLDALGVIAHGPDVLLGTAHQPAEIAVGLFSASGVGGKGPSRLETLLGDGFIVRRFGPADVRAGALDQFEVVVFPGGSGSGQARALGKDGRARVRRFVNGGGGYVGICAGAYLAANNYSWSLRILDANVIDRAHWARGRGTVGLRWTSAAKPVLGNSEVDEVLYANGPIYAAAGDPELPDFDVLATYRDEINTNGAPAGVMRGTPAIVLARFGAGRVVCSSPHPEQTKSLEDTVRRIVRAAVAKERSR